MRERVPGVGGVGDDFHLVGVGMVVTLLLRLLVLVEAAVDNVY